MTRRASPTGRRLLAPIATTFLVVTLGSSLAAQTPDEAQPTPPPAPSDAPAKRVFKPLPPPANFAPPLMEVVDPDFSWGATLQGEVVKHTFKILNKGGAPLIVTQVKPSCGCTTAAKPEQPIPPGESGEVTLQVDTKKFTGQIKKTADIYSNAGTNSVKVSLAGRVDPFFTLEPATPKIDVIRGIAATPAKVSLKRSSTIPLKVKEVKTDSKVLKASIAELVPAESFELTLTADVGDDPRKYYSEEVQIAIDAEGKEFTIPVRVSVTVKERIDVLPRTSVYFSRTETKPLKDGTGGAVSKTLDIQSMGGEGHSFTIKEAVSEKQVFETKVETVEAGKHYRLLVTLAKVPDDPKQRTIRDTVIVRTDDPTVPELKITGLAALQ